MVRLEASLQGLEEARGKLERTAERVAKAGFTGMASAAPVDDVDFSQAAISLIEARNQYLLNSRVLNTAEDMNRYTFDLLG